MNKRLLWLVGVLTVSTWAACNCGHDRTVTCSSGADCPSGQACVSGTCSDGSGNGDGGPSTDGGLDGGGDAGCVNLECQQVACPDGGTTTVTGKVYDPSGQVPLYNAIVYVPNGQTRPFPAGVSCDRCGAVTSGDPLVVGLTGPDGAFTLRNVPTGSNIPLVIQIGRWRRQVTLPPVPACTNTPIVDVNLVRLPRNQSEGDIPLMAIATGNADPFECLLRKMGISDSEFTAPDGGGRIHYYASNGIPMATPTPDAGALLWPDAGTLMNYDVVLLPCEGGEYPKPSDVTQNIINYTSAGGRVFTTHYGYVWVAFAQDPFPLTGDWRPDPSQTHNPPSPFTVNVDQSFPKGVAFADWLVNVDAGATLGSLDLYETRHDLFGVDAGSTRWLWAPNPNFGSQPSVQHMTFNTPVNPPPQPDGGPGLQCGRLVFSDFHVTTAALSGQRTFPASCRDYPGTAPMTAQEKALVFMLFDVSACIQRDNAPPTVCQGVLQACSDGNPCCPGLICKAPSGTLCAPGDTGCRCGAFIGQ